MLMTIRYQDGRRDQAVLLAASRDRMRIVTKSQRDAIELQKLDTCWFTEAGDEIEIESLVPLAGTDASGFCSEVYPRTAAASGPTGA